MVNLSLKRLLRLVEAAMEYRVAHKDGNVRIMAYVFSKINNTWVDTHALTRLGNPLIAQISVHMVSNIA